MTFTGSGARELRKSAAAALEKVLPMLKGVSGLSQAEKVSRLTEARDLVGEAFENLEDAVDAASSVEEAAPAASAGSDVESALRVIAEALGVTL